jgi:hypothetical protein
VTSASCDVCGELADFDSVRESYCLGCRSQCQGCGNDAPKGAEHCCECVDSRFGVLLHKGAWSRALVGTAPTFSAAIRAAVEYRSANPDAELSIFDAFRAAPGPAILASAYALRRIEAATAKSSVNNTKPVKEVA